MSVRNGDWSRGGAMNREFSFRQHSSHQDAPSIRNIDRREEQGQVVDSTEERHEECREEIESRVDSQIESRCSREESPCSIERKASTASTWILDPANPHNWSHRRKWAIVFATAFVSFAVGVNSTSIATPAHKILDQFHVSDDNFPNSFWPITAWTMAAAVGAIVGMPLLENFGTRTGYLVAFTGFFIFVIPQAVARNFATMLVVRVFAGFFGGVLQNGMGAFCADMYASERERDVPLTIFVLVYEAGVTLGPAWGSIFESVSWRWVFYSQLIIYGATIPVLFLTIKESRTAVIRSAQKKALAKAPDFEKVPPPDDDDIPPQPSLAELFHDAIVRPPIMLATEPVVLSMSLWSAFCFCLVYISIQSIESVYTANFAFSPSSLGLIQIALFAGQCLGFLACLPNHGYYQRSAARNTEKPGTPIPEARLVLAVPASFIGLAGGLFWYAWASYPNLHWALPTAGFILVGIAMTVIVEGVVMYITDSYTVYAGSVISAVALCENVLSAWVPLSTRRMYAVLGPQWASSLLGFVALGLSCAPLVVYWKGSWIRGRSRYMSSHS